MPGPRLLFKHKPLTWHMFLLVNPDIWLSAYYLSQNLSFDIVLQSTMHMFHSQESGQFLCAIMDRYPYHVVTIIVVLIMYSVIGVTIVESSQGKCVSFSNCCGLCLLYHICTIIQRHAVSCNEHAVFCEFPARGLLESTHARCWNLDIQCEWGANGLLKSMHTCIWQELKSTHRIII